MIKKSIIGLIVVIAAIGLVFAAYGDGNNNSSQKSVNSSQKQDTSVKKTTAKTSAKSNVKISEAQAQKIAQKYIEEPGAKAGKPKLGNIGGKKVYTVPVMLKGNAVGEIYISASTGKNLGGAGGVL